MTKDLTTGKIMPILVKFTIPLVLGNLFQLTYNAVDSIIVGHFVGKEALAAVGICNPITTLMILFLNGLCMGASILMGMQYGAKDYDTLHRQISTTMISGVVFSVTLTVLCVISVSYTHLDVYKRQGTACTRIFFFQAFYDNKGKFFFCHGHSPVFSGFFLFFKSCLLRNMLPGTFLSLIHILMVNPPCFLFSRRCHG